MRSAHEKYTLSQYTLLKTFKCIYPVAILYSSDIPCLIGDAELADKQKKKKKKGHRLRLDRGPVIKHYGHAILW